MVVNDNALNQMPSGAYGFFASKLAPTMDVCSAIKNARAREKQRAFFVSGGEKLFRFHTFKGDVQLNGVGLLDPGPSSCRNQYA